MSEKFVMKKNLTSAIGGYFENGVCECCLAEQEYDPAYECDHMEVPNIFPRYRSPMTIREMIGNLHKFEDTLREKYLGFVEFSIELNSCCLDDGDGITVHGMRLPTEEELEKAKEKKRKAMENAKKKYEKLKRELEE
jgi:hypothetical protein